MTSVFGTTRSWVCYAMWAAVVACTQSCASLPFFGQDIGKQCIGHQWVRPPYKGELAYMGVMEPMGQSLFIYVPKDVQELGVQILTPAPRYRLPNELDVFVEPATRAIRSQPWTAQFTISRCLDVISPDVLMRPCNHWRQLGASGTQGHAVGHTSDLGQVVRIHSDETQIFGALSRGLYRIDMSPNRPSTQSLTYLVHVGATQSLSFGALAKSLPLLDAALTCRNQFTPCIPSVGFVP